MIRLVVLVPAILAAQQQQQVTQQPLPPSPIVRIEIAPGTRSVTAGDSLQFSARALDGSGRPVAGAIVRFRGGSGEAAVDSTGKVVSLVLHQGGRNLPASRMP